MDRSHDYRVGVFTCETQYYSGIIAFSCYLVNRRQWFCWWPKYKTTSIIGRAFQENYQTYMYFRCCFFDPGAPVASQIGAPGSSFPSRIPVFSASRRYPKKKRFPWPRGSRLSSACSHLCGCVRSLSLVTW